MYSHVQAIEVSIWGRHVGTIVPKSGSYYRFEYDADFLNSGIPLAPFELPLQSGEFSFLNRPSSAFYGTSAGGAQAKAIVGWNPTTDEFCIPQYGLPDGFEDWIVKVTPDERPYLGRAEYRTYELARACGIDISESRLYALDGKEHFSSRHSRRSNSGKKGEAASPECSPYRNCRLKMEGEHSGLVFLNHYCLAWAGMKTVRDIRCELLQCINAQSMQFHGRIDVGQLMSRCTSDPQQVQLIIQHVLQEVAQTPCSRRRSSSTTRLRRTSSTVRPRRRTRRSLPPRSWRTRTTSS